MEKGEPWLSREYIYRNHTTLLKLEDDIVNVKEMIEKLNSRQKQLGVDQTEFPDAYSLAGDMAPFKQLWEVSSDYVESKHLYWSSKLAALNCE